MTIKVRKENIMKFWDDKVDNGIDSMFDWDHDGTCDHVGIVESCDGTTVHTIEGNSGDAVKQNNYTVNSQSILGYGLVAY